MKFGVRCGCSTLAWMLITATGAWAGQFKAVYSDVSDPQFQEWQAEMMAEQTLESLASELNDALTIPTEVVITFAECQTANAFYNSEQQAIVMCYELMRDLYEGALGAGWSEERSEQAVVNTTQFFFYHEVGHALIDVLELPTTGREEDAVDQLSMYALALDTDQGEVPALDAAAAFNAWAGERQQAGAQAAVWGEHSLDEQRFFNIVCWVFGQDPQRFQNFIADGLLPENRAARCPAEWAQIDRSWSTLLASYLK